MPKPTDRHHTPALLLTIQMTRRDPKLPLLRCVRRDGSSTMSQMVAGATHDIAHIAVETVLGFRHGFYGMLADGTDIQDFNVSAATTKMFIEPQAMFAEHVVNLLQMEMLSTPNKDFASVLEASLNSTRQTTSYESHWLPTQDQITRIRQSLAELLHRWNQTSQGETMEIPFDIDE